MTTTTAKEILKKQFGELAKQYKEKYPLQDISLPFREGEKELLAKKAAVYSQINELIRNARKK